MYKIHIYFSFLTTEIHKITQWCTDIENAYKLDIPLLKTTIIIMWNGNKSDQKQFITELE